LSPPMVSTAMVQLTALAPIGGFKMYDVTACAKLRLRRQALGGRGTAHWLDLRGAVETVCRPVGPLPAVAIDK